MLAAAQGADGMLAVSGAMRDDMIALGMPGERIAVHHTGIDHDRFRPQDRSGAKRAAGVAGPLVVSLGALIPRGPLGREQMRNLRIFKGTEHPHTAQNPEVLDIAGMSRKNKVGA